MVETETVRRRDKPPVPETVKMERANLFANPHGTCGECLHLIRLRIYKDEEKWFIGMGCDCGPENRLSDTYEDHTECMLDLSSLSWRN